MDDLISRQDAIDAIFGRSHEIIKMRIGNLPSAQPEQRWIPVSEKLPEPYKEVLVYYEYYRYWNYGAMYRTYGIGYCSHDGTWHGDVNGTKARCLAWRYLPEPYKGEER